ncbi:MAG TPA: uroporphyrinogen-III C-methyltransferase, partial [Bacillota bacterium]|nr:uroporphyrinogen-III C-methyltransferase [Bacillota bacterium]
MVLSGYVCLVGAGPGDAGLITRQGLAYLKRAEVVLYDHLVPVELLLEVRNGCELINVGKRYGKPSHKQDAINELLIAKARSGKFVVRLKGGDPFLFGRGGEEAQALVAAKIPYLFVPGVSTSLSVPAAAGIPVTDRRWAPGLTIGTGHRADNAPVDQRYTQVILMSLENLAEVTGELIAQGYPEDTSAAVISRGTTPFQKLVAATLATITARVAQEQLPVPALLVVGAVVRLAKTLEWRSNLPLNGCRILWTRPREDYDQALLANLRLLGAQVIHLPTFEIQPFDQDAICAMLPELRESDWVVFTSRKAVKIFFHSMVAAGWDWRYFEASRFAVVGERTAAAMRGFGHIPDLVAAESHSARLLQELLALLKPQEQVA